MDSPGAGNGNGNGNAPVPYDAQRAADNNGVPAMVSSWVMAVLATIFICLRFYAKISRKRQVWWDDYLLVASSVIMFCNAVVVSYMTINFDFGKHKDYLLPDNIPKVAVLGNISSTLVVTALCWSKTSFGMTLVRFTKSWTMAFIWLMVITMNMLFFWAALIQWIYCQPLDKVWDPNVEGTCWDHNAVVNVQITASAWSAVTDIAFAVFAFYMIRTLSTDGHERIGHAVTVSLGVVAAIFAIVKCAYLPSLLDDDDSYNMTYLTIWSTTETALTTMAACVPILRAMLAERAAAAQNTKLGRNGRVVDLGAAVGGVRGGTGSYRWSAAVGAAGGHHAGASHSVHIGGGISASKTVSVHHHDAMVVDDASDVALHTVMSCGKKSLSMDRSSTRGSSPEP